MSRKQRLESLAQLGQLTQKDLKQIETNAGLRREKRHALLGLWTIIAALALANAAQSVYIWLHFWK